MTEPHRDFMKKDTQINNLIAIKISINKKDLTIFNIFYTISIFWNFKSD